MGVTRMGKTTIFLADDDEGVRRTLRTFFEGLPGYRVVGEACDGMEAVEGCRASAPDVALLDIQMPLLDGVSVARQVLADRAAKCVIILTAFSDREHIERVQACGAALIIHDLTRQRQLEEELALQRTALQELRHRMKNNLQMLANLTRSRGCDPAESPPVQTALLDTANRLLSLAATLDGIVQVSREKVSLLQILEQIRRYMLQTLLPSARRVTIHVGGEDVIVSADCASSVALVVNELVQNALKYAFPSGQAGRIGIELHSGRPLCQLTVWDNGVGFQADRPRPGGAGLELASTIVREKLTGEWSVESGPGGTRISFDFLEQENQIVRRPEAMAARTRARAMQPRDSAGAAPGLFCINSQI